MIFSTLNNHRTTKRLRTYLYVTIGCGIFSAIYEHSSHEVYSPFMVYLFAIPLTLGVVPYLLLTLLPKLNRGGLWHHTLWAFAISTLIIGSALQGVVEIYGTTSTYITYYFWASGLFFLLSTLLWALPKRIIQSPSN